MANRTRLLKLTRRELSRYRAEVDAAADAAGGYVLDAMEAFARVHPEADTAAMRGLVVDLLQTALPNFCDAAATLAADLFDEMAEAVGADAESRLYDTIDYGKVEQKVRYFAKFLNEGDPERFKKEVADVTRYYVKRSALANMEANCREQNIKYARVPSGFETCAFCFMLASRGFVYGSERKAGKGHDYHVNCDCIVVPGFEGKDGNPRVRIDGYDPETMYRNWCKCANTVGIDPLRKKNAWTDEERKAVMHEVDTRDWHWLYTGETPEVDYSKAPRSDYGTLIQPGNYSEENIINPGIEWRDLFAHDSLSANGIRIETRPKLKRSGVSDIDLYINGNLVEVKSPSGSGERQVKNALISAKDQFARQGDSSDPVRVVFNGYYSGCSDEWIENEIKKRMRTIGGIYEVIQIRKDGNIQRLRSG